MKNSKKLLLLTIVLSCLICSLMARYNLWRTQMHKDPSPAHHREVREFSRSDCFYDTYCRLISIPPRLFLSSSKTKNSTRVRLHCLLSCLLVPNFQNKCGKASLMRVFLSWFSFLSSVTLSKLPQPTIQ